MRPTQQDTFLYFATLTPKFRLFTQFRTLYDREEISLCHNKADALITMVAGSGVATVLELLNRRLLFESHLGHSYILVWFFSLVGFLEMADPPLRESHENFKPSQFLLQFRTGHGRMSALFLLAFSSVVGGLVMG
jgi:hypothetical protein